jgi:hypothetical protein
VQVDERTLRVVVLPNAPSTEPLMAFLRALVAQSLVDPPILLVDESLGARRIGVAVEEDEVAPLKQHIESARCTRFLLVNLVTADALGPPQDDQDVPELRLAMKTDVFIRNALAAKTNIDGGRATQRLDVINLVIPAASKASMSTRLHSKGPPIVSNVTGWANVVVAPEVQKTSIQATVPVSSNEEYVAHAGLALITMAGCWAGASWEPDVPAYARNAWTVVRSRSRSLVAPELPIRVLSRIGRSGDRVPIDDTIEFYIAPDPLHAANLALREFIKRNNLTRQPFDNVDEVFLQQEISISGYFRMLWAWLTGTLPSIVLSEARERVLVLGDRVDDRINRGAGLDSESKVRIRWIGRSRKPETNQVPDEELDQESWGFTAPEPGVWSDLRALCFGLLDGGDVHDETVKRLLGEGNRRFVLGDRRLISPPPGAPIWVPSSAVAALRPGIGAGQLGGRR